jgi:hypothetical protein
MKVCNSVCQEGTCRALFWQFEMYAVQDGALR